MEGGKTAGSLRQAFYQYGVVVDGIASIETECKPIYSQNLINVWRAEWQTTVQDGAWCLTDDDAYPGYTQGYAS